MLAKIATSTVIVNPIDAKTLLIQKAKDKIWGGLWAAPGGKVDEDELTAEFEFNLIEKSAIREVKEETNIDVAISNYVCSYAINVIENNIGRVLVVVYAATPTTYNVQPQFEEVADARWFTYDEAVDLLPLVDSMSTILKWVYRDNLWVRTDGYISQGDHGVRYSRLHDGRILDMQPMEEGKPAAVVVGSETPSITFGEIMDSKPMAEEEIYFLRSKRILPD